eukprot:CAMPEP_0172450288 /NCGR_PEP_ID=MMETSP1065-20121228/8693_1 /TAXON_ID=265537 /ORGANISM="Amphiprora paludosa, Strain CCMP125" /LENGTH=243 /DNA_ID=CAMNT_0013202067 /DNA_START=128 /DNA_END=859 /DNA_ORIENTATION=+
MSSSKNDITIHCRARRTRAIPGRTEVPFGSTVPSLPMICTLCHWMDEEAPSKQTESAWPNLADFSYATMVGPEILLTPLDTVMPTPRNHRRCRSNSFSPLHTSQHPLSGSLSVGSSSSSPSSVRIPAHDITHFTTMENYTIQLGTAASVWELTCPSRNAHDLLWACLMTKVKVVTDQRTCNDLHTISTQSTTDAAGEEDESVDALTARCFRHSIERETIGSKLERRWGKAVNDITSIVKGAAV